MKLPGLSSSPPKTPDVTPNTPKPEAKPDTRPGADASRPSNEQNNSGNGGNSATGNFSNVAQGTGSLLSGGSAVYRANQSTQNQPQGAQGNQAAQGNPGAVSYGNSGSGSTPLSLQSRSFGGQQDQGMSSSGLSKLLAPLAKVLEQFIGSMLQHSGGGSSMQFVGSNQPGQGRPTPNIEINIQLGTAGRNSGQQAAPAQALTPAPQLQPAQTPSTAEAAAPTQAAGQPQITETEKDTSTKPTENTGRPAGDTRNAEEIIAANPILANLGHQKDINREGAYKQLGDWTENNKDPEARADAAYNAARVLNYIDASNGANGSDRGDKAGNGDLEGITKDGDARHGTPAGNWKDFTEQGYSALHDDHRLDKTNDTHVKADGSNKDNLPWAAGEAGKALWMIPGLSRVLTGIGDSDGSVGGMIKGGIEGAAETAVDALEGLSRGKNPASMLVGAYAGALAGNEAAPEEVRKIAGML